MAAEGEFPKIDGDVLYASEVNKFNGRGLFSFPQLCHYRDEDYLHVPLDDTHIICAKDNLSHIYRSEDGGKTYTTSNTGGSVYGLFGTKDGSGYAFIWTNACDIYYTHDFGATFTHASSVDAMHDFYDADAPSSNLMILAGRSDIGGTYYPTVLRTTDGGDTWHRTIINSSTSGTCYAISMYDDNYGFCLAEGSSSNLWRTTDGGQTWTEITGSSIPLATGTSIVATGQNECYVFRAFQIYHYDGMSITSWSTPLRHGISVTKIGDIWFLLTVEENYPTSGGVGAQRLYVSKDLETFYGRGYDYVNPSTTSTNMRYFLKHSLSQTDNYLWIHYGHSFLWRIKKDQILNVL